MGKKLVNMYKSIRVVPGIKAFIVNHYCYFYYYFAEYEPTFTKYKPKVK